MDAAAASGSDDDVDDNHDAKSDAFIQRWWGAPRSPGVAQQHEPRSRLSHVVTAHTRFSHTVTRAPVASQHQSNRPATGKTTLGRVAARSPYHTHSRL